METTIHTRSRFNYLIELFQSFLFFLSLHFNQIRRHCSRQIECASNIQTRENKKMIDRFYSFLSVLRSVTIECGLFGRDMSFQLSLHFLLGAKRTTISELRDQTQYAHTNQYALLALNFHKNRYNLILWRWFLAKHSTIQLLFAEFSNSEFGVKLAIPIEP